MRVNPFLMFEGEWFARSRAARILSVAFPATVASACFFLIVAGGPDLSRVESVQSLFLAVLFAAQAALFVFLAPLGGIYRGFREKGTGTFDLLVTSPVSARTLFLGLSLGASLPLLFLTATTLPVALLVLVARGIEPWPLALGFATLAVLCVALSSMGVFASFVADTPAGAWPLCAAFAGALLFGGPLVDALVAYGDATAVRPMRGLLGVLFTFAPALWALLCARRGSAVVRSGALTAFLLLTVCGAILVACEVGPSGIAVLSSLSPGAVLAARGFERLWGVNLGAGAPILCPVYLTGLALLFGSATYLKIEKLLDRRPFHEA